MRADADGGGDAGRGVAQPLAEPRGRGRRRPARVAPPPGLHPAPLQTSGEPDRRRPHGDVEDGGERRLPDCHVGAVEDADHDESDRPARGKARSREEQQQSLWPGRPEQRQDGREARPGPQAAEQPEDERLDTHDTRRGERRRGRCRARTNSPDARSHAMTQVSSNRRAGRARPSARLTSRPSRSSWTTQRLRRDRPLAWARRCYAAPGCPTIGTAGVAGPAAGAAADRITRSSATMKSASPPVRTA